DLPLAAEVAVEDGLAVFDALGEPAGGDRVPALLLGEFAGGRHDEALTLRPFALLAFLDRHGGMLALLDMRAGAGLALHCHVATLDSEFRHAQHAPGRHHRDRGPEGGGGVL